MTASTITGAHEGTAATALPPLRRNWRFQLLWIGSASALTGVTAADVAYPLVILALTGSPAWAGLFGVFQAAATVLFGLPAGVLLDRYDRRKVLIAAETLRVTATGSVVLAGALGSLMLAHLLVVAVALGAAQPLGGAARMLLVRAVVPAEQLTAALTQDELRVGIAELAGPPLGGFLYGLGRAVPFLFSTVGFAISLVCALIVRPQQPTATDPAASLRTVFDGVRTLWQAPTLRMALLLVTALNACGAPLSLCVIYRLREQSTPAWAIGAALAGSAVGGLVGAALVGFLHRRFRPGTLLIGIIALEAPVIAGLAVARGPWATGALLLAGMLGIPALSVLLDVLIFRQVPDAQRGRTISATMTVIGLGIPLGTGVTGLLLQTLGGTGTLLVLAGGIALAALRAAVGPALRGATWPSTGE
ncbi:MFS transporter [Streptacidiphilus jiangxiensis]|uniref:Predicted arabinose efflux permease, MFS family n=1 Tax=Streptacidiphilus jiangxiensis TaxID=235985 RepID=A0A1H7RX38_STRJI|nr:MFS transporter [Streptacidiphilus jiangxiensis]SEL64782.1 Predicted arabinose efflux permease, MFS family [Streptacidiphilus jiangxiensis]